MDDRAPACRVRINFGGWRPGHVCGQQSLRWSAGNRLTPFPETEYLVPAVAEPPSRRTSAQVTRPDLSQTWRAGPAGTTFPSQVQERLIKGLGIVGTTGILPENQEFRGPVVVEPAAVPEDDRTAPGDLIVQLRCGDDIRNPPPVRELRVPGFPAEAIRKNAASLNNPGSGRLSGRIPAAERAAVRIGRPSAAGSRKRWESDHYRRTGGRFPPAAA